MAWHRLVSSEGLGVGSVAATARGAKRERARSRARHGLSEQVDQRVNEVRGARTRKPIHWSKPDKGNIWDLLQGEASHLPQRRKIKNMVGSLYFDNSCSWESHHTLSREEPHKDPNRESHIIMMWPTKWLLCNAYKVRPPDRQDRRTELLSLSSLAWRRSVMQMATTSFSSARCAAHNQRGRPAGMREREKEIL